MFIFTVRTFHWPKWEEYVKKCSPIGPSFSGGNILTPYWSTPEYIVGKRNRCGGWDEMF